MQIIILLALVAYFIKASLILHDLIVEEIHQFQFLGLINVVFSLFTIIIHIKTNLL
jgi:hypothetical protein